MSEQTQHFELAPLGAVNLAELAEQLMPDKPASVNVARTVITRAQTDAEAVAGWLSILAGPDYSIHTAINARKEAERFMLWARMKGRGLQDLMVEDCLEYRIFITNPTPSSVWCGKRQRRFLPNGMPNPDWRPFRGALGAGSQKQATTILFGLFEYLCSVGYLDRNPWRAAKARKGSVDTEAVTSGLIEVERFLDDEAWSYLLRFIEGFKDIEIGEMAYPRLRWIFRLLYLSAARKSEVVKGEMGHIFTRRNRWWWQVVGKGRKKANIALSVECIEEMMLYRRSVGLPPLPSAGEKTPLVQDCYGAGRGVSGATLYRLTKKVFQMAADQATMDGLSAISRQLGMASTHWMRHTAASRMVNKENIPVPVAQRQLRHSNMATTGQYVHHGHDEFHDAISGHSASVSNEEDAFP